MLRGVDCWNSGGFCSKDDNHKDSTLKGRGKGIILRIYTNGIFLWQETVMTDGRASIMQQTDPNICIIHTPPRTTPRLMVLQFCGPGISLATTCGQKAFSPGMLSQQASIRQKAWQ